MKKKLALDKPLFLLLLFFAIISIITIKSAMTYLSQDLGNLALKQIVWYLVGFALIFFILFIKNEQIYKTVWYLYITFNILLVLLLFIAEPINNSKCWFIFPGIGSFQPSEFMKITLILTLGVMIQNFKTKYNNPTVKEEFFFLIKTFIIVLIPSVLTFLEPDTGAVMIYFIIYLTMIFLSGIRARWFIVGLIIITTLLSILFGLYYFKKDLFIDLVGTDLFYRIDRLFDWKEGTGFQLENAKAAIGSSGWFGHGFNKTPIYFPESGTDFIFAVFASNFGFISSVLLLLAFLYFDYRLLTLRDQKKKNQSNYILAGIVAMLLFQQIQNIGMTLGLLPIMGITLPFISYGGSSLFSYMIMIGIALNCKQEE